MHPFIKNVRTSSIRVIVTSLYIALVLCAINFIGVGMAPASGVNISVDFNSNVTSGNAPLTVEFAGISENATEWQWDVGDGTTNYTSQNFTHIYEKAGVYNVTLTVSGLNETVTMTEENYIFVYQPIMPEANFSADPSTGYAPLNVVFTDLSSNASSWDWNFGDGSANSTEKNPIHAYTANGIYTVTLTVGNMNGTDTEVKSDLIIVSTAPVLPIADFDVKITSGYAPLTVAFSDLSSNVSSWNWNFGDGSANSTVQNPTHTYNAAGTYAVTLTSGNENGTDTEYKIDLITVLEAPTYDVSPEVDGGTASVVFDRPTAEEGQTVNVIISDIQAGKQFSYINVEGNNTKNSVDITEVTPGVSYTFTMPAENVTVIVTLEDIPVTTYDIQIEVTGGNATVTTNPAGAAEKGANVTVNINDIELGRQFKSIAIRTELGNLIDNYTQSTGEVYTFMMPEEVVIVTVELEDSPIPIVTVTGIEVSKPPAKENYIEGETLDLTDLEVTLNKSDNSKVNVTFEEFAANGLTTNPANGSTLSTANTTVTITHTDGATVTQSITVNAAPVPVTQITVTTSGNSTTVEKGKTLQMNAAILPENASNKNVVWSVVKGSGTATISTGGLLTGTGAGTVIVKAAAADGSGVQDTIEITVTEAQSTTTATSGGGGGGGSQNTGEKNENIELKDYSIKYVLKDTETLFGFTKEGNSIISLGYTASLNGGQTKTVIEMLKGTSTLVNKAAPGTVYKNVNIWVGDGKAPAMLSDARIMFRVEKTWLSENRIDPASMRMCRYSGGSWNQLPTSMTGEDDTYVYYLARTPGFSAFAISSISEAQQAASTSTQQEPSLSNEESAQMSTADSKTYEDSNAVSQKAQSAGSFTLLLIITAITAIGILSYRHRDYLSHVRMQLGNPDGKRYRRLKKYN